MSRVVGSLADGGGFIITPNGIIPIPPWDPTARTALEAVAKAARFQEVGLSVDVHRFVAEVVGEVARQYGAPEQSTVVFMSSDGDGFTCGSTGRPLFRLPRPTPEPDPVPWRAQADAWRPQPSQPQLVVERVDGGGGVIDAATAGVLHEVLARGVDVRAFLQRPEEVAAEQGITVPPAMVDRLQRIPLPDQGHRFDEVDQEVVALFNDVVVDGRYVAEFVTDPAAAAKRIGRDVSPAAVERVKEFDIPHLVDVGRLGGAGAVMNPAIVVGVAVAIAIVLWSDEAHRVVIDRSGIAKL